MGTPGTIRLLDDAVINKIAAGEVVERPASVLKELLENALDAGATQVDVSVVGGGSRLLTVQDNGSGMGRDDALLAIERHATSKIRDVSDIEEIGTLGFRGEALAAIASVSRFTLITRTGESPVGTEVIVHGGTVQSVEDAGCPPGTAVTIRNLFFNVPARRKFLRTEQTEFTHLRRVFLVHALAHPGVAMSLTAEDREIYRLAGGADLADRIRELYGATAADSLTPVAYRDVAVRVTGFAGRPSLHRPDRSDQVLFVNGRAASAPAIGYAVREAYRRSLPKGRFPVVVLFVETDPAQVDVNVHPTKREVRFRQPNAVRDGILAALTETLRGPSPGPPGPPESGGPAPATAPAPLEPRITIQDLPKLERFAYVRADAPPSPKGGGDPARVPETPTPDEPDPWDRDSPWSWCRILGQVGGLYVVLESDQGLVLMDPQAAHERVLFERFQRDIRNHATESQGLVIPETVEVGPQAAQSIRRHLKTLADMGFGISAFGGESFLVDALPACLGGAAPGSVLASIAQALETGGANRGSDWLVEDQIALEACRAAVSGRTTLQLQEMERLVQDLARADMPYTCPHGRPTLIFMGFRELDRKFGRR